MMSDMLGIVAVCFLLALSLFGLMAQALKNYQRKSCEGLSLILTFTVFCAYLSWGLYGVVKPDYYVLSSQGFGVIMSGVLLVQFRIYREKIKILARSSCSSGRTLML